MSDVKADAKAIFLEALDCKGTDELMRFLGRACGSDAALRTRVEELIRAHRDAGAFLGGAEKAPTTTDEPVSVRPGAVIGPYKLLQQLGEGGMGTVFMAEQQEPVQRRVAVKVIKAGMDSAHVLGRFEAERQALALMDHPNIARVLDAGASESGRPYFVMELVKGIPITTYCDQECLTPRERLELFIPVCQAVQHAHQKGIIHRDLKPTNVLIALYDGKPVPKVIDFGVAKAMAQKLTERTMFTQVGQMVGTLEYMSPEQAELNQLDVDTRSDIYSLGVLLYELLTGSPPFTAQQLRSAAFSEMLRMIREVEPSKPSTKISGSKELPAIAAKRKMEPKRLAKLVRGDIDWIVMKCLEKERGRRYETANGLARDVERYLADEPVSAGPPGAGYRLRKFARRNRGPVLAAALLLLALFGGIAGTSWGLVVADQQRLAAEHARDDKEKARAEAVANAKIADLEKKQAEKARANAMASANTADFEKKEAEKARDQYHRTLYGADLNLIQNAWDADNIGRVRDLLDRQKPKGAEKDLRGFEWRYWDRLSHAELYTLEIGSRAASDTAFSLDGTRFAVANQTPLADKPGWSKGAVHVWDTATGKKLLTLDEVAGSLADPAFSPDGKRLVALTGKAATLWDVATGKVLRVVKSSGLISQVVFSPDSARLGGVVKTTVQGKEQEAVKVWDSNSGAELATCPVIAATGNASVAGKVTFSRDGKRLAGIVTGVVKRDRQTNVKVWDALNGKELATCRLSSGANDPESSILAEVVLSPDGKRVAVPVVMFDTDLMKTLDAKMPKGPQTAEEMKLFERAANTIAGGVRVWDIASGKQLLTLKGFPASQIALAFSPDGNRLGGVDGTMGNVKVWDATTGMERLSIVNPSGRGDTASTGSPQGIMPMRGLAGPGLVYSPDGKLFAASGFGGAIRVCDAETGEQRLNLKGHTGIVMHVAFSTDGKRIFSAATDGTMKAWDATPRGQRAGFSGGLTLSPNGQRVAELYLISIGGDKKTATVTQGVRIWDTATWKEVCTLKVVAGGNVSLAFSADGKHFCAAAVRKYTTNKAGGMQVEGEGRMQIWDTETGKEIFGFDAPVGLNFNLTSLNPNLTLSADGQRLAMAAGEQVTVWNAKLGKQLCVIQAKVTPTSLSCFPLSFSPDGKRLAGVVTTIENAKIWHFVKVWDAETGKELSNYQGTGSFVGNLAFSPDGLSLAAASGNILNVLDAATDVRVWEAATGKERLVLKGHTGRVELVAFSPDGKRIATTTGYSLGTNSSGNEVKIWDASTGAELLTLKAPFVFPNGMAFSSDGNRLLSVGAINVSVVGSQAVKIWDATPRPQK